MHPLCIDLKGKSTIFIRPATCNAETAKATGKAPGGKIFLHRSGIRLRLPVIEKDCSQSRTIKRAQRRRPSSQKSNNQFGGKRYAALCDR
jgi:hypothetical protein